jgi:hypothetical protein
VAEGGDSTVVLAVVADAAVLIGETIAATATGATDMTAKGVDLKRTDTMAREIAATAIEIESKTVTVTATAAMTGNVAQRDPAAAPAKTPAIASRKTVEIAERTESVVTKLEVAVAVTLNTRIMIISIITKKRKIEMVIGPKIGIKIAVSKDKDEI